MTTKMLATVVNGMFRPDGALPLAEQTRVRLTVESIEMPLQPEAAWESLKTWITTNPRHGLGRPSSRDELYERR